MILHWRETDTADAEEVELGHLGDEKDQGVWGVLGWFREYDV